MLAIDALLERVAARATRLYPPAGEAQHVAVLARFLRGHVEDPVDERVGLARGAGVVAVLRGGRREQLEIPHAPERESLEPAVGAHELRHEVVDGLGE